VSRQSDENGLKESLTGCLLGLAVGDALGLPYEALSRRRLAKLFPGALRHRFFFGRGMCSDDTEHTCMVAQSLIVSAGDEAKFLQAFAWRLRWWLLGLPAGVGFATLRAIVKLWLGWAPDRSGVFSAGNGAAMRCHLIGVCYGGDREKLLSLLRCLTRITHRDPKAEYSTIAVALATYLSSLQSPVTPQFYYQTLANHLPPEATDFLILIENACDSAQRQDTSETFANSLGLTQGVGGYVYHCIPVIIQTWLRHPQNYPVALEEIIKLGGDTDTTAAILGGIIGAKVGEEGIPNAWRDRLWEYPHSLSWLLKLAERLSQVVEENHAKSALYMPIYAVIPRNLFFLVIVLFHGFRRLLP